MTTPGPVPERERTLRRTTAAKRSVVAAGTLGAIGAAVAIGVTPQATSSSDQASGSGATNGSNQPQTRPRNNGSGDDEHGEDRGRTGDEHSGDDGGTRQQPTPSRSLTKTAPRGQLATTGSGSAPQGHSSGS